MSAVLKMKLQAIVFYPIPTLPFHEILEIPDKCSLTVNPLLLYPGQLIFDTSVDSLIGAGGFKIVYSAQLILTPPAPSGLGSLPCHDIIMKWPYHISGTPPNDSSKVCFHCHVFHQEVEKLF